LQETLKEGVEVEVTSERVHWLTTNITQSDLLPSRYDIWYDGAVFQDKVCSALQLKMTFFVNPRPFCGGSLLGCNFF